MLTITGIVAVYSASFVIGLADYGDPYYFVVRQVIWAAIGAVMLIVAARTDYRKLRPLAVPLMAGTILLLLAVLVIGISGNGAQRWIGFGGVTLQPAEFAKLTVTIYLAAWLAGKGDRLRSFEHGLLPFIIIIGLVGGLIMLQPNLGTTLIIVAITVTMFWVAGASVRQMVALALGGTFAVLLLVLFSGYRAARLGAFLNASSSPTGTGYQTLQALIALGNGGLHGLGLGASRAKFFYIPESQTDGVFAIIGEELGLLATVTIVILYVALMFRGYRIARNAQDDFGRLIATGVTTWICVQAMLNIGGITRVTPLTGVPLPFLSFGSNALAAAMLGMGVLISISRYQSGNRQQAPGDEGDARGPRRIVRRGQT